MTAPAIDPGTAAPSRGVPPTGTSRLRRFDLLLPAIVTAVLARIEVVMPDSTAADRSGRLSAAFLDALLRRGLELSGQDVGLDEDDLRRCAAYFAEMSGTGASLSTMQRFCRSMIVEVLNELWTWAEPCDIGDLLRFSRWLSRQVLRVEPLLTTTYGPADESAPSTTGHGSALAGRLLAGLGEETGARDRDPRLAARFVVVVLPADADGLGVEGLPAGTLRAVADRRCHLLVPIGRADSPAPAWKAITTAVAGRPGLRAAAVLATGPGNVPAAAASAQRLLRAAAAIGLPAGLVRGRDLLVETALAGHPRSLRQLSALLDPIETDVRLRETLVTFFAHDLDRTRTAEALLLSRSGLALRLDRIAQLTRHDPRTTRGIQMLRSALSARALMGLGPDGLG